MTNIYSPNQRFVSQSFFCNSNEAFHLLPVQTSIPAVTTLSSLDFLNIITSLVLVTMYSSVSLLNISCKVLVGPYKAILFRLSGKLNHFRWYLIIFSIAIKIVIVILYIIIGHNNLSMILLHNRNLTSVVIFGNCFNISIFIEPLVSFKRFEYQIYDRTPCVNQFYYEIYTYKYRPPPHTHTYIYIWWKMYIHFYLKVFKDRYHGDDPFVKRLRCS